MFKVDILAIGAHPDDVELCAGGTVLRSIAQGKSVGLLDLTQGELGTNGDGPLRLIEAEAARIAMGAQWRTNLGMADGFFEVNKENILSVAKIIRIARPQIILANAPSDRHPDHGRAAQLVNDACFISGLSKVEIKDDEGNLLERWRPKIVLNYVQDLHLPPDVVVDIGAFQDKKMEVISSYASQFFMNKDNVKTPISGEDFWAFLEARAREMGRAGGVILGEGFVRVGPTLVNDLFDILPLES